MLYLASATSKFKLIAQRAALIFVYVFGWNETVVGLEHLQNRVVINLSRESTRAVMIKLSRVPVSQMIEKAPNFSDFDLCVVRASLFVPKDQETKI